MLIPVGRYCQDIRLSNMTQIQGTNLFVEAFVVLSKFVITAQLKSKRLRLHFLESNIMNLFLWRGTHLSLSWHFYFFIYFRESTVWVSLNHVLKIKIFFFNFCLPIYSCFRFSSSALLKIFADISHRCGVAGSRCVLKRFPQGLIPRDQLCYEG